MDENNQAPTDTPVADTPSTEDNAQPSTEVAVDVETDIETDGEVDAQDNKQTLLGSDTQEAEKPKPIEYVEFQMPDGFALNDADSKVLTELGQEFQMPQEAVQKLVDLGVQMQQRQIAEQQKFIASWAEAAKQDQDYGGENLKANLLTAQRAFSLPRGDKISKILYSSGLGNHPDVIGFMTEVGKLLEPDNMVTGNGSNSQNVSAASAWYDKT